MPRSAMAVDLLTVTIPEVGRAERMAARAEADGWDGLAVTDSQNLVGDPFVALALMARATEHLQLLTGVTNPATRHPAALATAIATVNEESGGRAVLGIGRGDTALFHLGRPPMPVGEFTLGLEQVHTYLHGGTVDIDGYPSRLRWLDRAKQPAVPVDVAAAGPKVIAAAARLVERITFAVGAETERVAWALEVARAAMRDAGRDDHEVSFGAYVNVGCHPDVEAARQMVRGSVAAFTHFSAMPGSTGAGVGESDREVVAEVGRRYDSNLHLVNAAEHSQVVPDSYIDRFAVVGDPDACAARLLELVDLGLERLVITGPSFGADRDQARRANELVRDELLPALRG
jgi:5,10-methylenetetrahydromethanopterin reductase